MMSIKPTVIGSKIVSFEKGSKIEKWILFRDKPVNPFSVPRSKHDANYYFVEEGKEITVLQVVYEDNFYLVEFIEKE